MAPSNSRYMRPSDWQPALIEAGCYGNLHPLTGYRRADGTGGNPLHPANAHDDFEVRLAQTMARVRQTFPAVTLSRHHVQLPYRQPNERQLPHAYRLVRAPRRLSTTSVSLILIPQHEIASAVTGFCFTGTQLPTLRERLRTMHFHGLIGNLGYYMTAELLGHKFPWSHCRRYPHHPLPPVHAHIGFHLQRTASGTAESGFLGAHPAAVAVRQDGRVEILPRLTFTGYRITIAARTFTVHAINDPQARDQVQLFTAGLQTPPLIAHEADWRTYAPYLRLPERVNLFIAAEGDGRHPQEKVLAVWPSPAPLPPFGAVLSFDRRVLNMREAQTWLGKPVHVRPLGPVDLSPYRYIMGGLVPLVTHGQHRYLVSTRAQLFSRLREDGAMSPLSRSGRESDNFAPGVREPAGILLQTAEQIGWLLCDGRHELSLGADVSDVAHIVRLLEQTGAFSGPLQEAVFLDGGSAMKVYAVTGDAPQTELHLLNRVAAGSRNGPGADPDGLNLYSVLRLEM